MNKKALLACLLAVMMLLSGCSLVVKDAAVDAATEVVRVGDTVYTKGEVLPMVQDYLQQMAQYYSQYGYSIDTTSETAVSEAQDAVLDSLVRTAVIEAKEKELGFDTLSEETQNEVNDTWNQYVELIKSIYMADTELEGEELEQMAAAYVYYMTGTTKAGMEAQAKEAAMKTDLVKDVTVSDDEVKADFDAKVEAAKASYSTNLSAYGSAVNNGTTVYYRPAGYRMVKSILIKLKDESTALVTALNDKAAEQTAIATAKLAEINGMEGAAEQDLEALRAQVTVETAAEEVTKEDGTVETVLNAVNVTNTLPETLAPEMAQAIVEYQTARVLQEGYEKLAADAVEAGFAAIDEAADDVLAQVAAGADWDALMAEKTEDPGMKSGATAERGYAVCEGFTSFDSAFVNAAMGLANVGDVTGKVRSDSYGYFIIKYVEEVAEGAVDLADVQDGIRSDLLTAKQDEAYNTMVDGWVATAGAKVDKKALND